MTTRCRVPRKGSTTSRKRPDGRSGAAAIMGYSFGGYFHSSRIAAPGEALRCSHRQRLALHWDLAFWPAEDEGHANRNAPKSTSLQSILQVALGGRRAKDEDGDEGIEIAKKFSLKDVAKNITCSVPSDTRRATTAWCPVENAQKLYDAVGSDQQDDQDIHRRGRRR